MFSLSPLDMNNFRKTFGNSIECGMHDILENFIPCLSCFDMIGFVNIWFSYRGGQKYLNTTLTCMHDSVIGVIAKTHKVKITKRAAVIFDKPPSIGRP